MFSLIWAWINSWVNNHEAGDVRRHHAHYDVTVMMMVYPSASEVILNDNWVKSNGDKSQQNTVHHNHCALQIKKLRT